MIDNTPGRPAQQEKACVIVDRRAIQTAAVARAIDAGLMRSDVPSVAAALWSQVHGWVVLELDGLLPTPEPDGAFAEAVEGWRTPQSLRNAAPSAHLTTR
ncbi:MAG: TetR-like C-terminal domain-containing protein [Propionibacteriaceae bacterium]|nr:TetR-like C-terminal domain-containing protein [Propionibacteriaceae bacterium]